MLSVDLLFLGDDRRQAVAGPRARSRVGAARRARHGHPHLDRVAALHVARLEGRAAVGADRLALRLVGVPPDAVVGVRRVERRVGEVGRQVVEVEVPLRTPHGPADVQHIVVGDHRVADPVAEHGRALLVGGVVVPHDPVHVAHVLGSESAGQVVAAERRVAAGLEVPAVLADVNVADPLAVVEVDVAVGTLEGAVVVEPQALGHQQAAVVGQPQRDVRVGDVRVFAHAWPAPASVASTATSAMSASRGFTAAPPAAPGSTCGVARASGGASKNSRRVKAEYPGDDHGREDLDQRVVGLDGVVVDAAGDLDLVLGIAQLLLELAEVLRRLELRIGLGDHEQLPRAPPERVLGLGSVGDAVGRDRLGPGRGHALERRALVRGVALDRLDERRDQVVAAAQGDVDLRPAVLARLASRDHAVVGQAHEQGQPQHHRCSDDHPDHGREPIGNAAPRRCAPSIRPTGLGARPS